MIHMVLIQMKYKIMKILINNKEHKNTNIVITDGNITIDGESVTKNNHIEFNVSGTIEECDNITINGTINNRINDGGSNIITMSGNIRNIK